MFKLIKFSPGLKPTVDEQPAPAVTFTKLSSVKPSTRSLNLMQVLLDSTSSADKIFLRWFSSATIARNHSRAHIGCRDLLNALLIRIGTIFPGQSRLGSFTPFLRFDGWNSWSICSRVRIMSSSRYSSSRMSLSSLFCILFDWYSSSANWKIQSQNKFAWLNSLKNVPLTLFTTERCNLCRCRCNLMKADRNDDNFQQRHREHNFVCR